MKEKKNKKKFRDTQIAAIINKVVSSAPVRGVLKPVAAPVVELVRNATTPSFQDKPHKSGKWQVLGYVIILAILTYLKIIPVDALIEFMKGN